MAPRGPTVLALAAALAGAACGGSAPEGATATGSVGAPAPDYAAVSLAGDSVALSSLRGEAVLLNVWATWCAPCREEIPVLQALHEARAEDGLKIVGVSVDAGGAARQVRGFADDFGMTYALWHDPGERVMSAFLLHGVPSTILIDRAGIVRWRHVGPVKEDDPGLARALDQALYPDGRTLESKSK